MHSRSPRHSPARPGAAVHRPARGPAATPPSPSLSHPVAIAAPLTYAPNAALLIDFDNVTMGIRSDLQTELRNLLASDIIKGKVQLRRAYADWRRYPQYVAPLAESSIDMIMAPAYGSSKKNATDIRLAIDALELVFTRPEIGTYILLSGDSDFSTLVIKLKEYGKYVIGVGIRESSSDLLVMNCDEYYSYNTLAGLVRADTETDEGGVRRDPWELVSEGIARMQRNNDVMRADRLKQVMQDIDSSFDEKNLGMSKFSRFVQEAAQRGLLTLTKLENGQLEVAPPGTDGSRTLDAGAQGGAADAAGVADGRAPERAAEREERGRRGRRGRGRGREGRGPRDSSATLTLAEPPADTGEFPAVHEGSGAGEAPRIEDTQAATSAAPAIGASGERLTRDEAFTLVRRAVASLVRDDETALASDVRARAFELLGRDSESLGDRNFSRILRDAHDANVIDLRRQGDDYTVALAAAATPVAQQLNQAVAARGGDTGAAAAGGTPGLFVAPQAPVSPALPRGLGLRTTRRGGGAARISGPPPELLTLGVVDVGPIGTGRSGAADLRSTAAADASPVVPTPMPESGAPADLAAPQVDAGHTGAATSAPAPEVADTSPSSATHGRAAKRPRSRPRAKRAGGRAATSAGASTNAAPAAAASGAEGATRPKRGGRSRAASKGADRADR